MSSAGRVLVYGGTGAQGRPIVRRLLADGFEVRVLMRTSDPSLAPHGATAVMGDLGEPDSLRAASEGCQAVVLMLPLAFDVTRTVAWAENAVRAAEQAGVETLVFDTSAPVPDAMTGVAAVDIKVRAQDVVRSAGMATVVVRPTLYLGNLAAPWSAPSIVNNRVIAYPLPDDVAVAWSTWEDVAACISAALIQPGSSGRTFDVGGHQALTGPELAATFSRVRGREHSYAAIPLPGFEAGLNAAMGEPIGTEIAKLYGWFAGEGRELLGPQTTSWAALGVTPQPVAEWIAQQDWNGLAQHAA